MSDSPQPMTCGPQKRKRGRPRKHVDLDMVERLAAIQCTHVEIASTLGVSVDTLTRDRRFAEIYKRGAESGRKSLRRMQFESALKGNVTMMIWLGKQYLGQSDQGRIEVQQLPTLDELSLPQLARLLGGMRPDELREVIRQMGGRVPGDGEPGPTINHVAVLPPGYKN
jgi:AT hook motif